MYSNNLFRTVIVPKNKNLFRFRQPSFLSYKISCVALESGIGIGSSQRSYLLHCMWRDENRAKWIALKVAHTVDLAIPGPFWFVELNPNVRHSFHGWHGFQLADVHDDT